MPKKCYVLGCTSGAPHTFKFPQASVDKTRFLTWLAACGNSTLLNVPPLSLRNRTICILHFEAKYIMSKRLSSSAVPTLCLPDKIEVSAYEFDNFKDDNSLAKECDQLSPNTREYSQEEIIQSILSPTKPTSKVSEFERQRDIDDDAISICAKRSQQMRERKDEKNVSPLSHFGLTRKSDLSPTDKKLYNVIARLRKATRDAQKATVSASERLKRADKLLRHGSMKLLEDMPETTQNFLMSHFRNMKRNKYNRQYTMPDKVFALALYKRSSRAYSFLQGIFSLPSVPTLRKLVRTIPIRPGLCRFLFQAISDKVNRLKDDKSHYCVLLFDETSLDPTLQYNPTTGSIDGFVDNGDERELQIANHATVWMLKGVQGNWKQPILYSFCHSTISWEEIVRTYKAIVREAAKFGLTIISSVCDQGATNVRAIKYLIEISKREFFQKGESLRNEVIVIDDKKIVPLFDPPHLIKCVRNNLLTKDVKFTLSDGVQRTAKWSHVETAYRIDNSSSLRTMKKLTDYHIDKEKIKKMKVKYCTQVFSNTVASVIDLMSRSGTKSASGELCMPHDGQETALFLDFMNNLFDSVNGDSKRKISTTASDENWDFYIRVLRTISYVKSKPGDAEKPIVLKNWIQTLQGFKYLKLCLKNLGFEEFNGRVFNQDALENFFGQLKQHGMRDTKPNCSTFHAHYKTLLMQSFSHNNSRFNCELDESSSFLVDLRNLLTAPAVEIKIALPSPSTRLSVVPYSELEINSKSFKESIHRFVKDCKTCRCNVFGTENSTPTNSEFDKGLVRIGGMMPHYISQFFHIEGFTKVVVEELSKKEYFAFQNCDHAEELLNVITKKYVVNAVVQYLKKTSRILSGRENPDSSRTDNLMLQAHKLYKINTCRRSHKIEKF